MANTLLIHNVAVLFGMEHTENGVLGRTEASSILIDAGKIAWMGPCDAAPTAQKMIDATGLIAMPGIVDCHTHTVWGGSRADEFRQRLWHAVL